MSFLYEGSEFILTPSRELALSVATCFTESLNINYLGKIEHTLVERNFLNIENPIYLLLASVRSRYPVDKVVSLFVLNSLDNDSYSGHERYLSFESNWCPACKTGVEYYSAEYIFWKEKRVLRAWFYQCSRALHDRQNFCVFNKQDLQYIVFF